MSASSRSAPMSPGILSLSVTAKHAYLPDLPDWLASHQRCPSFRPPSWPGLVCAALAFVVGAPLMRLSGYFVSVATLGFLIIVNVVLINAVDLHARRPHLHWRASARPRCLGPSAGWSSRCLILARIVYSPYRSALSRGARGHDRGAGDRRIGAADPAFRVHASAPSSPASAARSTATISARSRRRASTWPTLSR